jgi:hypothetical protein
MVERPSELARGAHVHPHALGAPRRPERSEEGEEVRLALSLQREPNPVPQPRSFESTLECSSLLPDTYEVMDIEGRSVLASDPLGVATGDREAAGPDVEPGPAPPCQLGCRALHAGGKATRTSAPSDGHADPGAG